MSEHSVENDAGLIVGEMAEKVAAVLAKHRYRDVLGDYEVAPFYKHFGCTCGWEQNIAGMSGWRSWMAAHDAHLAAALLPLIEAGAADDRGDDECVPLPAQLLRRFYDGDADERLAFAERAIVNSEKAHLCFLENHRGRIAHLERQVRDLRADLYDVEEVSGG